MQVAALERSAECSQCSVMTYAEFYDWKHSKEAPQPPASPLAQPPKRPRLAPALEADTQPGPIEQPAASSYCSIM
jgi:hypothetical protein